jgi:hypothetical protein
VDPDITRLAGRARLADTGVLHLERRRARIGTAQAPSRQIASRSAKNFLARSILG